MRWRTKSGALVALLLACACDGATRPPEVRRTENPVDVAPVRPLDTEHADPHGACGDTVGAWSSPVDGLRGRMVTSDSRPDRASLRVTVELENVSGAGPLEIHWSGRPNLGYVAFRLQDMSGRDVPEPDFRLGGNEPTGNIYEVVEASHPLRHDVADNVFEVVGGRRLLRLSAFWCREMPTDGSRRLLAATVTGHDGNDSDVVLVGDVARMARPGDTRGRVWKGSLVLPPVCIR